MDIRVLGAVEVVHDGVVRPVIGKPAALLGLLVAAHPRGVTADALIDAVWPEKERKDALNNMRVNLGKVRDVLPERDQLAFEGGRYHLHAQPEEIDAVRFRDLAAEARAALGAGNVRRAATDFGRALDEWRGLAYENVFDVEDLDVERRRLAQVRLDALRDGAMALITDDRPDDAVRLLQPEWEADRAVESIAEPLVLALVRCRRPVDALNTFRATRDALREDHGMDASAEFCALEYEILEPAPATTPTSRHARTVRFRRPSTFIGREPELAELHRLWDEASAGAPRVAVVSGPAGIGKSTLLLEFVHAVNRTGASVLVGTCVQDPSAPYGPFPELVRTALTTSTDTPPELLAELSHLAPELGRRLPAPPAERDPSAGREHLFDAVATVLSARSGPRLVVVDDLQWAGLDAVELLQRVIRRAAGQTMVICCHRTTAGERSNPFVASRRQGRLPDVDLDLEVPPMNRHELVALIDDVASRERRLEYQYAIDELEDITAGNPLMLCEAIRQLDVEPDRAVTDIVPDNVRALVDRRLGRLTAPEQRIIRVASVIGRVFTLGMVVDAAGVSEDEALDALDVAVANGLVLGGPGPEEYTFAHPLIRTGVYQGQVHARRVRTHVRLADVLEAQDDPSGEHLPQIARHLLSARPVSDARRTWHAARAAGDDALRRFAHDAAVSWYESALECEDATFDEVELAELRVSLGTALDRDSRVDDARMRFFEAAEIARATDHLDLLVRAVEAATPREGILDRDYAARFGALVDDVLANPGLDDAARVSMLRSATVAAYYEHPERLPRIVAEIEQAAEGATDTPTRLHLLAVRALTADRDDDLLRLECAREACAISTGAGQEVQRGMAVRRFLSELLVCGRTAEFDAALAELTAMSDAYRIPIDQLHALALRAVRELMRAPDDQAAHTVEAVRLAGRRAGVHWADGLYYLQDFALRYQRGTLDPMPARLPPVGQADPRVGAGLALHGLHAAETGRFDVACEVLDRIVHDDEIELAVDNFWLGAAGLLAAAAATCGTPEHRRVLRAGLEPRAERFCVFGTGGAVFGTGHLWLGRMAIADGEPERARDHLSRAAEFCHNADARYWGDRALRDLADLDAD